MFIVRVDGSFIYLNMVISQEAFQGSDLAIAVIEYLISFAEYFLDACGIGSFGIVNAGRLLFLVR